MPEISIHALCEEGDDQGCQRQPEEHENFYPRPLRGGRLYPYEWSCTTHLFLSTPSARRATLPGRAYGLIYNISIHALCEEGDAIRRRCAATRPRFLSTPSARRATALRCGPSRCPGYFYPRPLRGGRLAADVAPIVLKKFLSTPSARRATTVGDPSGPESVFLSTPSARRATPAPPGSTPSQTDFYPRPLRGGRRGQLGNKNSRGKFLSTPSARRATTKSRYAGNTVIFLSTPSARRAT